MECKNCKKDIKNSDRFCPNCGTITENKQIYQKTPKLSIIMKVIVGLFSIGIISIIIMIINFFRPSYKGKIHEYEDFINHVESIDCNINNKENSCNINDKYEVVSDKYSLDEKRKKVRTITFKIKDTNFTFNVESYYQCTNNFDGACFEYEYKLKDNFHYSAYEYYINEYNKMIGLDNKYCYKIKDNACEFNTFYIKNTSDLKYVVNYMNGFLDYVNSLDFKFIPSYKTFGINFEKKHMNDVNYNLLIFFDIANDKYTYKFRDEYFPIDMQLETYINNYMKVNEITLN